MNTISLILEADNAGQLHVPLPPEYSHQKLRVEIRYEPLEEQPPRGMKLGAWEKYPKKLWMAPDFDAPLSFTE